jgi:TetR/AcrR family hemagglutinin/protease transcriptional regulator
MAYEARKAPRRRLAPEQRKAQLLEAALRVFARRGIGRAGHTEIAGEAAVSVSTVFLYFPTREELVTAVFEEVNRFLQDMASEIYARELPAPELIHEHVVAFARSVDTHPDYARVWLDWSTAIRDETWPRYLEFQEKIVALIAATITRGQRDGSIAAGVDPQADARLLIGSAHMIAQMKFSRVASDEIDRFIDTLVSAALGRVD